MSRDRARQIRRLCEALWEVELTLDRARYALKLSLSEQSENEILEACLKGLVAGQDAVEALLVTEPPPGEQWEFEKRKFYRGIIKNQCKAKKPDGTWCRLAAKRGSLFCYHHQGEQLSTLEDLIASLPGFPES